MDGFLKTIIHRQRTGLQVNMPEKLWVSSWVERIRTARVSITLLKKMQNFKFMNYLFLEFSIAYFLKFTIAYWLTVSNSNCEKWNHRVTYYISVKFYPETVVFLYVILYTYHWDCTLETRFFFPLSLHLLSSHPSPPSYIETGFGGCAG